jgi:leader peptidase (prepilin peptidase)/N-methyltransferase
LPTDNPVLLVALAALFGVLFGSFLNVCIYRLPRDLSIITPRSFCPECGHPISWYDNLPLLSYAILRGRCRSCGKSIGIRYVVVEFTTAALFALTIARYGPTLAALKWCVFDAIMVALFWTDLEERILPDELTLGGTLLGLIFSVWVSVPGLFDSFSLASSPRAASVVNASLGGVLLSLPIWLLGSLYGRLRKRDALGRGDIKLLAAIGVFLGLENGLFALFIGAVSGSVLGLAYILWKRKDAASYELPFGSFLCFGAVAAPLISKFAVV